MYYKDREWFRDWKISLIFYLRDFFVNCFPFRKLPLFLVKFLYGSKIDFIFLVHPRRSQDYFVALPFLTPLRKLISKPRFMSIINKGTPFVLDKVETPYGFNGLIVSSLFMPSMLRNYKRKTLMEAQRMIRFSSKICKDEAYIGLGAWWPIVTKRGEYLQNISKDRYEVTVTNGHTMTIMSIMLSIEKICDITKTSIANLRVIIMGAGKIGSQVANILLARGVEHISFLDINHTKLFRLKKSLSEKFPNTRINIYAGNCGKLLNKTIFENHHIGVCCTSAINDIVKDSDLPDDFIIIDDSRPEGVSRNSSKNNSIVLEGGLIKIPGLKTGYDFGFGVDDNVFGCLAETIVLSLDKDNELNQTIGNIDENNFFKMLDFCKNHNIMVGDFKTKRTLIKDSSIQATFSNRIKTLKKFR